MNSILPFADCTDASSLDSSKHVNFVQGMVLGVDDFVQEFAWHAGRHRAIARDLVGYGTVSGLLVAVDRNGTTGAEVTVEPGVAVTRSGELVRVKSRQCARIGEWLSRADNRARLRELVEASGSPPVQFVRVHVRLRYRSCLTNFVPIPGEPCRSEEEAMAASRVADSWRLHLSLDRPEQTEEDAVRELVHWLKRIPIVANSAAAAEDLVAALRQAVLDASPPGAGGELHLADPPVDLFVGRDDLCECLRAVLLVWTTELRPRVQDVAPGDSGCGCEEGAASPPQAAEGDDDITLAELWVPVQEALDGSFDRVDGEVVGLHEESRPYLLHLRMLQELVLCGPDDRGAIAVASFGSVLATSDSALLLWVHHPAEVDLSAPGALSISVNGAPVTDYTLSAVEGTINVFEIRFGASPPEPGSPPVDESPPASPPIDSPPIDESPPVDAPPAALSHGDRIELVFDVDGVVELGTARTLGTFLQQSQSDYLDHEGHFITVRAIAGILILADLVDVDTAGAANDDVLTFRDGTWQPAPVPRNLDDLGDVDLDLLSAADGEVLTLDNGRWHNAPLPTVALDDLTDVDLDLLSAADGEVLTLREGRWHNAPLPASTTVQALDDLSDVEAPEPPENPEGDGRTEQEGMVLTYLGRTWQPARISLSLADLTDVDFGENEGTSEPNRPRPGRKGDWLRYDHDEDQWVASPLVRTGVLLLPPVEPRTAPVFGPFEHGFDRRRDVVMIRLAFMPGDLNVELAEDTLVLGDPSPRMLVICRQGTNEFFVQVQPPASQREPIPYRIRWFATLADEQKAQAPPNPDPIPVPDLLAIDPRLARNAILAAASDIDGMRGAEIAKRLRLRPDELRPILVELGQRNLLNYDANGDAIRLR